MILNLLAILILAKSLSSKKYLVEVGEGAENGSDYSAVPQFEIGKGEIWLSVNTNLSSLSQWCRTVVGVLWGEGACTGASSTWDWPWCWAARYSSQHLSSSQGRNVSAEEIHRELRVQEEIIHKSTKFSWMTRDSLQVSQGRGPQDLQGRQIPQRKDGEPEGAVPGPGVWD